MNAIKLAKIRLIAAALAILAFGIGLAGCGGDDVTSASSGQTLKIAKPALVKNQFYYTGSEYTVTLNPANPAYTLGGDSSATEIGDYTATVTLVDAAKTVWADGTTVPLSLPWSIAESGPERIWYGTYWPEGSWPKYDYCEETPFIVDEMIARLDAPDAVKVDFSMDPDEPTDRGYFNQLFCENPAIKTNKSGMIFPQRTNDMFFITPESFNDIIIKNVASIQVYPGPAWLRYERKIDNVDYYIYLSAARAAALGDLTYSIEFN